MRKLLILFLSGLIFGASIGLVSFKAANINFNAPTQESVSTSEKDAQVELSGSSILDPENI